MRGIFALLNWSLRVDARSLHSHLLRLVFVVLLFFSVALAFATSLTVGAPGLKLFETICFMNFLLITLGGISYFSTTVTEEKEAGSLSLLKLAGLNSLAVLLGKSASRLFSAVMLLLVQFPFILLAITLGGITFAQIFAAYLALASFLVLIANLALFASVRCRTSGNAAGLTGIVVTLYFALPMLLGYVAAHWSPGGGSFIGEASFEQARRAAESASILHCIDTITRTGFAASAFSNQVKWSLMTATGLFIVTWLLFERSTRSQVAWYRNWLLTQTSSLRQKRYSLLRVFSVPRVWKRSFAWKEFYFLAGGKVLCAAKFVLYGLMVVAVFFTVSDLPLSGTIHERVLAAWNRTNRDDVADIATLLMLSLLVIETSVFASRVFFDEVRLRSLSAIILAPRSVPRIAWGKVSGCMLALLPCLFWLAVSASMDIEQTLDVLASPSSWWAVLQLATFLHLASLFSLYVSWGALPLALVATFFLYCCPVMSFGFALTEIFSQDGSLWSVPFSLFGFGVCWLVLLYPLELEIASRLKHLAGR